MEGRKRLLLCLGAALISVSLGVYLIPPLARGLALPMIYLLMGIRSILLFGLPAALVLYASKPLLAKALGYLKLPTAVDAGLAMLAGVSFTLAGALITALFYGLLETLGIQPELPEPIVTSNLPELLAALLTISIITGICEELMFRGALPLVLQRFLPIKASIFISSLVFALLHFSLLGLPVLLAFGLMMGQLTQKKQSLVPAMLFHAMYNLTAVLLDQSKGSPSFGVMLACLGIFLVAMRILLRQEGSSLPQVPG